MTPARGHRLGRICAAAGLELRVQRRYQVITVAAVLCGAWTLLLMLVPEPAARVLGPAILLIDTATFGTFFIAALVLLERGEGALAALRVSPLRPGEYLGVKLATLTGLSVLAAVPIALAAGRGRLHRPPDLPGLLGLLGPVTLGVGLAATLILTLSFLLVLPHRSLTGYLATSPLLLLPLLATPLAHLAGVVDHPFAYAVPTTGAADLIAAGITPEAAPIPRPLATAAVAYLLMWIGLAVRFAVARSEQALTRPRQPRARKPRTTPASSRPAGGQGWLGAFYRVDLRSIRMDLLLVLVLAAPVLLAATLRLGYRPLLDYVDGRFGVDLSPSSSLLLVLLVVAHVPIIMGMVGSLLVLDDMDERRLQLLRVTPVTLERYLGYRLASTGVAALCGLLLAVPLAGMGQSPPAALLLAAAQAPLIVLVVAAFARNKVQGLGLLKLLGGLVMVAASTAWWLPAAARWPLFVLPPAALGFVQRAAEAGNGADVTVGLCVGATATVVIGVALTRRVIRQLTT